MNNKPCRRCSECEGCDHHWIDVLSGDKELGDLPEEAEYVCKHCPALGGECVACDGTGESGWDEDEDTDELYLVEDLENCEACRGSGVIELKRREDPPCSTE